LMFHVAIFININLREKSAPCYRFLDLKPLAGLKKFYTVKLVPQPQLATALGLLI